MHACKYNIRTSASKIQATMKMCVSYLQFFVRCKSMPKMSKENIHLTEELNGNGPKILLKR